MQALQIEQLTKTYGNDVEALKGISITVEEGDFFALLGPNGAGKSTTIGIICSLVNKSSGSVKVFGHDIDKELTKAKRHIGLVPQEFNFSQFERVLEIVVNQAGYYGIKRKDAVKRAEEVLTQLALWDKRDTRSRELSGGMKRRLMIARALMHKPRLLILDEPTAGVDIEIRRSMWEFLQQLNEQGTTIVLTTHYLEEAETLCRNIAIIDSGEIVVNTDMKSIIAKLDVETLVMDTTDLTNKMTDDISSLGEYRILKRDNNALEVEIKKGQGVNKLFSLFEEKEIQVMSLRNKTNRLEELFVRLVENKSTSLE
ncbi:MAG: ABC transporter ATP-binding protein [Gammaproteobacteria bacterium]|nr:MAG: ABC transporter ATP-binding protein [Gammaproteobacteria bacterium]